MKERPILFNGAMVRAILRGQKTQTRRPVKPRPDMLRPGKRSNDACWRSWTCPFGKPGDRLWVKETFAELPGFNSPVYRADGEEVEADGCFSWTSIWHPSIHMPRSLSRITLEITDINVERVQDITEEDARAEGVPWAEPIPFREPPTIETTMALEARKEFRYLWDLLYVKRGLSWHANPWVWVIKFKKVEQ